MIKLFDLVLNGGMVADGTGKPLEELNIGINKGKIAAIETGKLAGERVIDARGLVIAPGFIDVHSHTDAGVLVEPSCQSKITQGITTEVSGNCGSSSAPILGDTQCEDMNRWRETHGISESWTTMGEFLDVLETKQFTVNFATYVGHSNVRTKVVGRDDRQASPSELEEMRRIVAQAMSEGAFGLSTGLIYPPSCFANTAEITALAEAIRPYDGVYTSHIRSERDGLIESVEEAITIGREAGVPVQIAHHKACGSNNWGKVKTTLGMIDEARAEGLDVNCDQYPYLAGSTGMSITIPKWAHDGGSAKLLERLRSETRNEIRGALKEAAAPGGWIANDGGWTSVVVSGVSTEANKRFEGKNILEIAEMRNCEPEDAVIDLLIEEECRAGMIHFAQCEDDVQTIMKHPAAMFGTDASARALTGPTSQGKPHPRSYGAYPKVLGRYVREMGLISLEYAIKKMTSMPARKLGIVDRGVIAVGNWADLTVFSPDSVIDTATYTEPHNIAKGINYVIVNGQIAVENSSLTGVFAGRVLRKTPLSSGG